MSGIINNNIDSIRQIFDLASDGIFSPAGVPPQLATVNPEIAAQEAHNPSLYNPIYTADEGVNVLNIIGSPNTPRNEVRINSLLEAFQGAKNLNGTPGRLFNPRNPLAPYQEVLNEKILQETQPLAASIPEPSLVLGLLSLGLLGIGSKLIKR